MGFGWVFGFSELSGSSPDFGLWIREIIHSSHLMLLVDWVTVMELTRGPISQHSWFTWWSGFELDFRVFGFLKFGTRSRLVDQGDNSQHSSDAFGRPGNSSGVYSWFDSVTFMVHMVVGILVGFGIFGIPRLESKRSACPPGGVSSTHGWLRVNRVDSLRAETMLGGLPRAFRQLYGLNGTVWIQQYSCTYGLDVDTV